jgi:acyl-CoA thioester hydrolase
MPNNIIKTTFHIRYAETDQMGVVHHAAYVVWLEEGRSAWMRANGASYAHFEKDGFMLALSDVNIRYRQATHYDRQVTICCWISEVRSRQVTFDYEVVDTETGVILAEATTKLICLNQTGQVTPLPEKWRHILSQDQPK